MKNIKVVDLFKFGAFDVVTHTPSGETFSVIAAEKINGDTVYMCKNENRTICFEESSLCLVKKAEETEYEFPNCADWMEMQMKHCVDLYRKKNSTYGDSFAKSVEKYGLISALTRISDKFYRIENLILGAENKVPDESISDTLIDLANYAFMTAYEIERKKNDV